MYYLEFLSYHLQVDGPCQMAHVALNARPQHNARGRPLARLWTPIPSGASPSRVVTVLAS
jgi:hypothetical protein